MLQGLLEQFPPDVWARVLMHLNTQDLLQARLVSKRFVQLSKLLELDVTWSALSEEKGSSLALFVQQNCFGPESLRMIITLAGRDETPLPDPYWLRVGLATSCGNLRKLLCRKAQLKLQRQAHAFASFP